MERILITGANRGIGLGLVRRYLELGERRVFATCRRPDAASELQQLAGQHGDRLTVLPLEVTDLDSIAAAAKQVAQQIDGLDLLINNAGINPKDGSQDFAAITPETMLNVMNVNVVGPLMVVKGFVDLLKAGNNVRLVNISSQMGSLTNRPNGGPYAYCSSKSALNMVTRTLAADLKPYGVTTITVHPGWVRTDMGGPNASLTAEDSTHSMVAFFDTLNASHNGLFYRWDGESLPW